MTLSSGTAFQKVQNSYDTTPLTIAGIIPMEGVQLTNTTKTSDVNDKCILPPREKQN